MSRTRRACIVFCCALFWGCVDSSNLLIGSWETVSEGGTKKDLITFRSDMTGELMITTRPDGPGVFPPQQPQPPEIPVSAEKRRVGAQAPGVGRASTRQNATTSVIRFRYVVDNEKSPHWIDLIRDSPPSRSEGLFQLRNNGEVLEMLMSTAGSSRPPVWDRNRGSYTMARRVSR